MNVMTSVVNRLLGGSIPARERGQGLAEYALILALIAIIAIIALIFLGGNINTILSDVGNTL
jgi:pilus assembly protein Flp/PilA